jgi:molybdopterin-guanine dinucleotide biosynthesis protein B
MLYSLEKLKESDINRNRFIRGFIMVPVVSFAGTSGSGKTTLTEQVVSILVRRGFKISVIKHDAHGFEIDHEGKDTWRYKQAGASRVLISGPDRHAVISDGEADLDELIHKASGSGIDLVVIEGYKSSDKPKIEVFRESNGKKPVCLGHKSLLAVVTDSPECEKLKGVETVLDINSPELVANFVENWFLTELKPTPYVSLVIDGVKVELNRFASFALANTVKGYLKALKGGENAEKIDISIDMK